ncbi:hypothetical protein ZMO1_ZMO1629 [Zymomonas mobilis subsp. mobilis ZM4 = ATCC 31821]|uniref:Uncharacterized protein n=1 Tax=Zymomonas mobilis subsp. mobilis (strain ATCC 31821 / ZM4 / CP4) TaxID=264203 RepID=Q5NM07_ZYMMO|nr:hypothetical protein [Zymomonas mobilis]AAV90253.1 conserved hypothetical protein [Zymomonas mobilis subsp. mobilis ZM4 = ATCC 31821]AHB10811.1 hypothetical protein ZCP4_1531 [Zymomonas mobilis subsp. mobilis str. CP4 = NRRL B-14023]AHJ71122.1 hypothetical protein A254_01531 [Zymomonas mobilis subsp. mobilis NRRL B-12526]AHJ72976.1 hypothetical protein A265_01531 [Zymomonas mobilis subsp. mobilis str. CP4 = NRRL B-14023]ART93930.1 hypothetical protein B9T50_07290 [Zymomonas mobilis subsp. m
MKQGAERQDKDWLFKFLAAFFLGIPLLLGVMGLVGLWCHNDGNPRAISSQLMMWMLSPLWITLLGLSGFFRSSRQAWGILGGLSLFVWAVFFLLRGFCL